MKRYQLIRFLQDETLLHYLERVSYSIIHALKKDQPVNFGKYNISVRFVKVKVMPTAIILEDMKHSSKFISEFLNNHKKMFRAKWFIVDTF